MKLKGISDKGMKRLAQNFGAIETIAAKDVQVDDSIYNSVGAKQHPAYAWDRVWKVEYNEDEDLMVFFTGMREYPTKTYKHPEEGVAVKHTQLSPESQEVLDEYLSEREEE